MGKSCDTYSRLLKEGNEPAVLVRQLEYHFSKLLECIAATESGKSTEEALRLLRPPLMFDRKNDFLKQLRIWNKDRLLSALELLYECERDCKTTGLPAEQCAGQVILRLSAAVKKFK